MKIVSGLIKHTVLVIVGKAERAIPIQALLSKNGCKVLVSTSALDGLKMVGLEMPHLIISESILTDGNAGMIYDRAQNEALSKDIPILVLMYKKNKEELSVLANRGFAGFLLGGLDPQAFVKKVSEILQNQGNASPFFISADGANLPSQINVVFEASALGKKGSYVIFKSTALLDAKAQITCQPNDKKKEPVQLSLAHNITNLEEVFNLFPFCRMRGSGREWLAALPKLDGEKNPKASKPRGLPKVIFYDTKKDRVKSFKHLLHGYDLDVVGVDSASGLITLLSKHPEEYGAVFFNDIPQDFSDVVKQVFEPIPKHLRPSLVVSSTDASTFKSSGSLCFLPKPFGLGSLLETLEAALEKGASLASALASHGGVTVELSASANLIGLDEVGGIFELSYPAAIGAKIFVEHKDLQKLWGDKAHLTVTGCLPTSPAADFWHVRFEAVPVGTSKAKYWEKITKSLNLTSDSETSENSPSRQVS